MSIARSQVTLVMLMVLAGACRSRSRETWGFVATLGNDTTSVEWMTRDGDRITGEAVGRAPMVVRRRWEMTLGRDGAVRRWSMDTYVPNAPADRRNLHHELTRQDGTLRLVRQVGSETSRRAVRELAGRTVPWNAFLYATTEVLVETARTLPDTARVGLYFFEGWSEGKLGFARARPRGGGRVAVTSTGLAGTGEAGTDASGRMLSYSGEGTTYKQQVRRVAAVPDLGELLTRMAAEERATGGPRALSVRDTARGAIGAAQLAIDYGRPLRRGRVLVGGLIPYSSVWRTGANAATQLQTTAPIRLAGVSLDAGTYTLWTLPKREGVQLIINRETGQWGTEYDPAHDIARVSVAVDTLDRSVEQFTIRIDPAASRLVLEWGTFRWSVPVEAGGAAALR